MSVVKIKDADGTWTPIDSVEIVKRNVEGTKPYIPKVAYHYPIIANQNGLPDYSGLPSNQTITVDAIDTRDITNWSYFFSQGYNTSIVNLIDTSNGTNFQGMFSGCTNLTTIPEIDTSNGTNFQGMFSGCTNLTTISKIDLTNSANSVTNIFNGLQNLTNIVVCGSIELFPSSLSSSGGLNISSSKNLTVESLMSIINACKDYTDTDYRVIRLGQTNLNKLSEEQKAVAANKNIRLTL